MKDLGYKNNNAIINLGTLFVFVVFYLFKALIILPLVYIASKLTKQGQKLLSILVKSMFFTEIILLLIEGFMEFLISGYLNTIDPLLNSGYNGDIVSAYVGYFCLFKTIIFMPCCFIYMFTRPLVLIKNSETFKKRWHMLYLNCKDKSKFTIAYYFVFMIRRQLYLLVAFLFTENTIFIAQSLLFINLFVGIYQGQIQPRLTRFSNRVEMFNEVCIELTFLHMLMFTSWVTDPDLQYSIGFSMVAIISVNIVVNLVIVFYYCFKALTLIFKKYKAKLYAIKYVKQLRVFFGLTFEEFEFKKSPSHNIKRFRHKRI